jgi:hypothetical protein
VRQEPSICAPDPAAVTRVWVVPIACVRWHDGQVRKRLPIEHSNDMLALDDAPGAPGYHGRISRLHEDGTVAWTVGLPSLGADDAWTDVRIEGETVLAHKRSCYLVTLDLATGVERGRIFTK